MTKEEMIYVLQNVKYHAKGYCTNVEYRYKDDSKWRKTASPVWDFDSFDYRIKPETKRVPLTMQDLIDRELKKETMMIINKDGFYTPISFNSNHVYIYNTPFSYSELMDYTFLDGTPCYKEANNE